MVNQEFVRKIPKFDFPQNEALNEQYSLYVSNLSIDYTRVKLPLDKFLYIWKVCKFDFLEYKVSNVIFLFLDFYHLILNYRRPRLYDELNS